MPPATLTARGSNAGRSRAYNRALVLRHIRDRPGIGRAEIARAARLSVQAVSNIIAELLADGLVAEAGRRLQGRGLPPVQYRIAPAGGFAFGLELRPRGLALALVDLAGGLVWEGRERLAEADPGAVARALAPLAAAGRAALGAAAGRILGAGVVMPGPFGTTGLADPATEPAGWAGTPALAWFEAHLGLPCIVENDANAAALAERLRGGARVLADFAFLYFGAGLGLGVVAGDRLLRGARGNAGEIGHLRVEGGARLEALASRVALEARLLAAGLPAAGIDDLAAAVAARAAPVEDWLAAAAPALAEAVAIIENLFDPETVFLGGVLPDALIDLLIARIPLTAASLANRPGRSLPRLLRGAAGRRTAVLGAAALVIEGAFTPRLDAA